MIHADYRISTTKLEYKGNTAYILNVVTSEPNDRGTYTCMLKGDNELQIEEKYIGLNVSGTIIVSQNTTYF